ncbi:protein of unknown function [Bradyrhizobium sp. ORS 285]|uniref:hypothetical protein n=1 Tax=Bradyrhizobium sp. ORS 285 TaxID=115808 RepID=UPI0002406742|nr:hypothetical protein [Bradyrhizobium sp. ORS 285]CCD84882.1 hypothetical protein BRAO285_1290005 [Bradyrhizobium sp. ORS 285]SMX56107.1 protein of unknown function [Bradyrhizobium sp. ORS 285]
MAELMLVDNDVLFKTSCYDLAPELISILACGSRDVASLALAKFVLKRKIEKSGKIVDRQRASKSLDTVLASITSLEPDDAELGLAAQYEEHALSAGYAFDSGESQLLAVLVNRAAKAMVTGDKRAIAAAWRLATDLGIVPALAGRIACFEQVMLCICAKKGGAAVAASVCAEAAVDKAMSICFGCSSTFDEQNSEEGLNSYVEHLRGNSGELLGDNFFA